MASADNPNNQQHHSNPSSEISIEEIVADDLNNDDEVIEEIVRSGLDAEENDEEDEEEEEQGEVSVVRTRSNQDDDDDDDEDDYEDETLVERLAALTEMFPSSIRHYTNLLASSGVSGAKGLNFAAKALSWIVFSSASILFLPIMIETERMGIEEAMKMQQRQILLGPGAAMSGGGGMNNAPLPV